MKALLLFIFFNMASFNCAMNDKDQSTYYNALIRLVIDVQNPENGPATVALHELKKMVDNPNYVIPNTIGIRYLKEIGIINEDNSVIFLTKLPILIKIAR